MLYSREKYLRYRENNVEKIRALSRKYQKELRPRVLAGYGAKCVCCGETRYEFLALDHINGGGKAHVKTSKNIHYRDALKRNFPPDYQILCHNCNMAKGFYGFCPHEKERQQEMKHGIFE
jgi:hypothetical protein